MAEDRGMPNKTRGGCNSGPVPSPAAEASRTSVASHSHIGHRGQRCTVTVLLTCVVPAVPLVLRLRDHSGEANASGPAAMTALQLPANSSLSAPTYAGTSGAGSLTLLFWLGNPALPRISQRTHTFMMRISKI